jgi:hypothetical protein
MPLTMDRVGVRFLNSFIIAAVLAFGAHQEARATQDLEGCVRMNNCPEPPGRGSTNVRSGGGLSSRDAAAIGLGLAIFGIFAEQAAALDRRRQTDAIENARMQPDRANADISSRSSPADPAPTGLTASRARSLIESVSRIQNFSLNLPRVLTPSLRTSVINIHAGNAGKGLGALISRAFGREFYEDGTIQRLSDLAGELILTAPTFGSLRARYTSVRSGLQDAVDNLFTELKNDVSRAMER